MNKIIDAITRFVEADFTITTKRKAKEPRRESSHHEATVKERFEKWQAKNGKPVFIGIFRLASVLISISLITVLLVTVSYLPKFGDANNPVNNTVSERYIEKGLEETGAVNIVAGMILDYRAFDTFGESSVLFTAAAVVMMLMKNKKEKEDKTEKPNLNTTYKQIPRDMIVKNVAKFIIPFLLVFGIYIILNGHISPGGGFAGGAIMGASLILYSSAYGYNTIHKYINEKAIRTVTFCSLSFYAIAKGYSFYTGSHHLPTGIPLGTPGAILSSGLILPLNIAVGLIVTGTMYSFYSLFSKGDV